MYILNTANACYSSVQNLLSSQLLSDKLRMFENEALRRLFVLQRPKKKCGIKFHDEELQLYLFPNTSMFGMIKSGA
jgi:hypothetical protein